MRLLPVDSSVLATIAYDPETAILRVGFHDQTIYDYAGVPHEVYAALLGSPSKGSYFNRAIRSRFAHTKVSEASPIRF